MSPKIQARKRKGDEQPDVKKAKESMTTRSRKDYHFMMYKDLHKALHNIAIDREISLSELFDGIASQYLREIGKPIK